jgi:hypothetical protein
MRNILIVLVFIFTLSSFAQETKTIKSGYITFISNALLEFKNLTINDEKVTFFNEVSKSEMSFALQSIKKIVDGSGALVYQTEKTSVVIKTETIEANALKDSIKKTAASYQNLETLVYKSAGNIQLKGEKMKDDALESLLKVNSNVYSLYQKGRKEANLGSILMGGGIGLFIGGGLSNLSNAESQNGKGSPVLLIVGLATAVVGIPVRIGGATKVKRAIASYNNLPGQRVSFLEKSELKFVANVNTIGFCFSF